MMHSEAYAFCYQLPVVVELGIDFASEALGLVVDKNRNQFHIHALIGYHIRKFSVDADVWVRARMHF